MLDVNALALYSAETTILQNITFRMTQPGVVSLIGQSGAGKTSVLRCVAGLETYLGQIQFNGTPLDDLPTHQRSLGYVEQHQALFPHLTLTQNIAYPLQLRHYSVAEITSRVQTLLQRCQLTHCADRLPHHTSGGEQRRAMLARTFIYEPSLILFDEPFSALDAFTRLELVRWLKTELHERPVTALYVTHDIPEARFISDQAIILDQGKLVAYDSWSKLDSHSPFVTQLLQTHF